MSRQKKMYPLEFVYGIPVRWDFASLFSNLWNPRDERIFPEASFGPGWDLNFHALFVELGLLKSKKRF